MQKLELPPQGLKTLFGVQDQNIKYLESLLDVSIGARGNELLIDGDERDIKSVEQILRDFAGAFVDFLRAAGFFLPMNFFFFALFFLVAIKSVYHST